MTHLGTSFGMELESAFPIDGLRPLDSADGTAPRVAVTMGEQPAAAWDVEPTLLRRSPRGRLLVSLHEHHERGYRMYAAGFGAFDVSRDGLGIVCYPDDGAPDWLWQRFLLGQALPFAGALRGIEPFHASAVEIRGQAVAIAGGSGAGKSSLALNLVRRGARFCTDDVVAILPGTLTVAPGPSLANVRDATLRRHAERGEHPFGEVTGRDHEGVRARILPTAGALRLGALYFVERHERHRTVTFCTSHDPYALLGHTYNVLLRTAPRLERQLDACARIAAHARMMKVTAPPDIPADDLARLLAADSELAPADVAA